MTTETVQHTSCLDDYISDEPIRRSYRTYASKTRELKANVGADTSSKIFQKNAAPLPGNRNTTVAMGEKKKQHRNEIIYLCLVWSDLMVHLVSLLNFSIFIK